MSRHRLLLAAFLALPLLPAPAQAAAALRISCDGSSAAAEVSINGQFKGECPLDVQVEPGEIQLRAVKREGKTKQRVFEQTLRLGDNVVKRIEILLGAAEWTAEGRRLEDERLRAEAERLRLEAEARRLAEEQRRAEAEARRLAEEERQRAEAARLAAAVQALAAAGVAPGSGSRFRDCDVCPAMVWVPAGSFTMGDPAYPATSPAHRVDFARPFALGAHEVTFDEWDACVREGGCGGYVPDEGVTPRTLLPDRRWGRGQQPVINIALPDALRYVEWLSSKTGKPYRLPSEAEWEYACRAGGKGEYCGAGTAEIRTVAWFPENSDEQTHPVGQKRPNAWGLHDMTGNVWEWVQDCWHDNYQNAPTDGSAWTTQCGPRHASRGGSWHTLQMADARGWTTRPASRDNNAQGLRVVRALVP